MRTKLIILAAIALLLVIAGGTYFFMQNKAVLEPQKGPDFFGAITGQQQSSTTSRQLAVQGNGEVIAVNNFTQNGDGKEDPANAGNYYLAGDIGYCYDDGTCPETGIEDFSIVYFAADTSFSISLNTEPLAETRLKAERFLKAKLGITDEQMCALNYNLGTTVYVNSVYGSMDNLGFSFCPGAVVLPQ